MLLTITYTGPDATDLGYLLHKNPARPQVFKLSFGKAYAFYPEADENRCTAALLLDIDPIDLVRGKAGARSGGLFDYVNDRPYVSSSFMSQSRTLTNRRCVTKHSSAVERAGRTSIRSKRGFSPFTRRLAYPQSARTSAVSI
jgi:hypothetical protein